VSAAEPPPTPHAKRWGLDMCNTRQHRNPPLRLGEVQSHKTRGNAGALPCWEAESGAVGYTATVEPT
jgi:hypothetical protein